MLPEWRGLLGWHRQRSEGHPWSFHDGRSGHHGRVHILRSMMMHNAQWIWVGLDVFVPQASEFINSNSFLRIRRPESLLVVDLRRFQV